jgi:hypothetical protein
MSSSSSSSLFAHRTRPFRLISIREDDLAQRLTRFHYTLHQLQRAVERSVPRMKGGQANQQESLRGRHVCT